MTDTVSLHFDLAELEVGRVYRCVVDRDRGLALEPTEKRGRPRSLRGHTVIAARALKAAGYSIRDIAKALNTNPGAVRTALGVPR